MRANYKYMKKGRDEREMKTVAANRNKKKSQPPRKGVTREEFEYRMELLEVKTEQLDRKISRKADDIVSIQLLQHRQELEEIYQAIKQIDIQIKGIERELDRFTIPKEIETRSLSMKKDNLRYLHT